MKNNIKSRRSFLSQMFVVGTGSLGLISLGGCSNLDSTPNSGLNNTQNIDTGSSDFVLTGEQKDELFFIYQEEKVARDVYITLGKLYPSESTFASIQLSEQRHIDAAQSLCEIYGIDLSEVNEDGVGNFVLPVLQDLYDTCISLGEESLLDALKVGELVEVTDIKDLDHAINDLDMPDNVIRVYEKLREGSYNHLEAFQVAISIASS